MSNLLAEQLRQKFGLSKPKREPMIGDIVEVDGKIGVCTESYAKGWCYVRDLENNWLDFIIDEVRHGKCVKQWRIRDDL